MARKQRVSRGSERQNSVADPMGGGGGGSSLAGLITTAVSGGSPETNPEFTGATEKLAAANEQAKAAGGEGGLTSQDVLSSKEQGALTKPFKPSSFGQRLGGNRSSDAANAKYAANQVLTPQENTMELEFQRQQSIQDREQKILDNAVEINQIADKQLVDKYGVSRAQRPDLFEKVRTQVADERVSSEIAKEKALQSTAINTGGIATRAEDLGQKTQDLNINAEKAKLGAVPIETQQKLSHQSFIPVQGTEARLDPRGNIQDIIRIPGEKEIQESALTGKTPAPSVSPYPKPSYPNPPGSPSSPTNAPSPSTALTRPNPNSSVGGVSVPNFGPAAGAQPAGNLLRGIGNIAQQMTLRPGGNAGQPLTNPTAQQQQPPALNPNDYELDQNGNLRKKQTQLTPYTSPSLGISY